MPGTTGHDDKKTTAQATSTKVAACQYAGIAICRNKTPPPALCLNIYQERHAIT